MPNYVSETHKWPKPDGYTEHGEPIFVIKRAKIELTPEQRAYAAAWETLPAPNLKGQLLRHRVTAKGMSLRFEHNTISDEWMLTLKGDNPYGPFTGSGKTPEDALADLLTSLEPRWGDP